MNQSFEKFINLKFPLLITGETGTGKSYLAKEIYEKAQIFKAKFVTVHLASLKEDLIESELFGHRKGAFTGALENKNGYFYEAQGGTLFLDEIGELSLDAQKKLLYLLEERRFTPVGSSVSFEFKGRIIMATNKNLHQMVEQKKFREDLFFRIKTFQIEMLSLRNDVEKLEKYIESIFDFLKKTHSFPYARLSSEARSFLLQKEWRGNLRELKNALEYAMVMGEKNIIEVKDFPMHKASSLTEEKNFWESCPDDFHLSLERFEETFLTRALQKNSGKVNETAKKIGISKTTLIQRTKKYRINTLEMRAKSSLLAA